jgi:hypothetical protein
MAVLLRSVKATASPSRGRFRRAGIPFVVTGMTNLFGTAEAEAARSSSTSSLTGRESTQPP